MPPPIENMGQARAIAHCFGPIQVLAGPGSGKTFTIVKRILNLINHQKIPPEKILVITFTKAAALEMQSRFLKEIRRSYSAVSFGTFHSIYYQMLSRSGYLSDFSLISEFDKIKILRKILNRLFPTQTFGISEYNEILNEISLVKNLELNDVSRERFHDIYEEYCDLLKEVRKIDFDDMILSCFEMFNQQEKILKKWQNYFSHLLVDEFQDINRLQYLVLKQIAAPRNNLFIVGDDDQSIYGFRGANPSVMQDFINDFPECEKVTLGTNYRSTNQIVTAASKVIILNKNRMPKEYQALRDGGNPAMLKFLKREDEDNWLVKKVSEYPSASLKNIAVILRTNHEVSVLAAKCIAQGIKVRTTEKVRDIFSHFTVMDILDYISFACGERERGRFLNIINKPMRYLSRRAVAEVESIITEQELINYYHDNAEAQTEICRFFTACERIKSMSPYLAINFIRQGIGYDRYLKERAKQGEFTEWMGICDELLESCRGYETFDEWLEMIKGAKVLVNDQKEEVKEKNEGLNIITMHSSKGLEFQTVFLPHLNESIIPSPKALTDNQIEEERRLFYVAMTRAKEELYMTYTESTKFMPSRFLEPL